MRKLLLAALVALSCIGVAEAAGTGNSVITPQTPNRGVVRFLQGTDSAGTYKTLYTAGSNGSKCFGLWMNNNDASVTHLVTVQIVNGGFQYGGVALTSIVNAGFASGTAPQALMTSALWPGLPLDNNGNPFLFLASGDTLQATYATNLTSGDQINVGVVCADY